MGTLPDPERVSRLLLDRLGHCRPPTDLDAVCKLWPDLSVSEEDLDKEGYLIPLGVHGAELLIRRQDPPARKAFTLTHELGHWVLANLDGANVSFTKTGDSTRSFLPHHARQTPEEVWCNKFAASLLMPKEDIYKYLHDFEDRRLPDRVITGSSVFCVSPEAFFTRVADVTPISLFEVVLTGTTPKVRRRFPSQHQSQQRVKRMLDQLLDHFMSTDGFAQGPAVADTYRADAKLIRASEYGRSWLVAVLPVDHQKIP